MKKFILAALAASVALSPMAASVADAQGYQRDRHATIEHHGNDGRQGVSRQTVSRQPARQYRSWRKGERFDRRYARDYREINYRQYRGLRAPPRGYHYVRSGNDAVLVGVTSGIIAAVVAGAIR